jgi:uncharacterized protein YfaQ (DUF2300 family)
MKKPKNSLAEEEEVRLEDLTSEEMKQVVAHFVSLIRFKTSEKSSEADQLDPKGEN